MTDRIIRMSAVALLCGALAAPSGMAQTLRPQLDLDTALRMQSACIAMAKEKNFKVAIAIYDYSGRLISAAHMDGAPTAVADFAHWKAKSAATIEVASEDTAKWNTRDAPVLATFGGGVPVLDTSGNALGGIGVSGAATEDDIACAKAGIAAAGMVHTR